MDLCVRSNAGFICKMEVGGLHPSCSTELVLSICPTSQNSFFNTCAVAVATWTPWNSGYWCTWYQGLYSSPPYHSCSSTSPAAGWHLSEVHETSSDTFICYLMQTHWKNPNKHVSKAAERVTAGTEVSRMLEFSLLSFSASYFDGSGWNCWRPALGCELVEIWLCPALHVCYWTCAGISLLSDALLYSCR